MMGAYINMTGKRFGKWTVLCRDSTITNENNPNGKVYWICKCDCGTLKSVNGSSLRRGTSKSCGCESAKSLSNRNTKDLTNKRIGKLTVLGRTPYVPGHKLSWICLCDCGKMVLYTTSQLRTYKSCGCLHEESRQKHISEYHAIHGNPKERLYHVWNNMRYRCFNKNHQDYPNYGGRGISVCDEWKGNYLSFREWAYKNGYDENAPTGQCTLDRIDVNGNYEPSNCRWVDTKKQASNRRRCRFFVIDGEQRSLSDWCELYGASRNLVYSRVQNGWDIKRALTEPKRIRTS